MTCFLKSNNDKLCSVTFLPFTEKTRSRWRPTISEEGALSVRFREPKTFCEEELVEKAVPSSTKYDNKWTLSVFGEWQFARMIKVPVLDPGGLFKDYDLHKVATLSADIEEMFFC